MQQEIVVIKDSNINILKSLNNCMSSIFLYSGNTIYINNFQVIHHIIYCTKICNLNNLPSSYLDNYTMF
jgi:hypothetical protein